MYTPKHFDETRLDVLHDLIRQYPLATLVITTDEGMSANHIPLHLDATVEPFGCLRGHVARANPLWQEASPESDVLVMFHGPNAYVSPSWYPSKRETGKVVPTWNYAVVHAYGRLRAVDDPVWLRTQLESLTQENEADFSESWKVADAPVDYTNRLITAIVGIEIPISRILGKWKMSQNQSEPNREGVREGLLSREDASAMTTAQWILTKPTP